MKYETKVNVKHSFHIELVNINSPLSTLLDLVNKIHQKVYQHDFKIQKVDFLSKRNEHSIIFISQNFINSFDYTV